ncbi:hypothetical protein AZE42_10572 [Rhizopogon vesiculosus]|uniref:Uncharacterized protein n=1 Tax=Rhizopogon vesiculosus TaxID=180088 RepID=A0A1J8PIX8_9AGAM|nr:hypothetical protein AZE42_10572 [Rhizopogon vesiculosus]
MLVLLYEQAGEFNVLLTTQSKSLRALPGQTASPEEKQMTEMVVWPGRLSSNPTSDKLSSPSSNPILRSPTLSSTEVDRIFRHPLEAMPDPQLILNSGEPLVGEEDCQYGAVKVHISVAKLAYEWNLVYGRHPSNPQDDQGGSYRALDA